MPLLDRVWNFIGTNWSLIATRLAIALVLIAVSVLLARILCAAAARAMRKRAEALVPAARTVIRLSVIGTGIVMALDQIGINITTVIAGAGVAGLAVGFGAQTLVKDTISGFFILFDEVLAVGDQVKVGDANGVVETIGLRLTQIRGLDGTLWSIPNGQIGVVANMSREWHRIVVPVLLDYDVEIPHALRVLQSVGQSFAQEHGKAILETPEAQGILQGTGAEIGVRLLVKVNPRENGPLERALRVRVKEAFDREKMKIKFQ